VQIGCVKWLLLVLVAGCQTAPPVDGAAVYGKYCTPCHGPTGKPPEQMVRTLNVRDLTSPELRARVTAPLVEAQVRAGSPNKLMPSFVEVLDDAQIKSVAAYVASPAFLPAPP